MKKIAISTVLSLVITIISAQSNITGFGLLQLGMSSEQIPLLAKAELISSRDLMEHSDYENENKIYEIKPDTLAEMFPYYGSLDMGVKCFYIDRLNVTPDIVLEKITLRFKNDKLYAIKICDFQMKEILVNKYGEPSRLTETEDKIFADDKGNRVVKEDSKITSTWRVKNLNFACFEVQRMWYSELDGKLNFMVATFLHDKNIQAEVGANEEEMRHRMRERELLRKKEKLKSF